MALSSILDELRDFDTALLANTIGYIDRTPAHEYYMAGSIQSVTPSLGPTVGIAVTCELDSSTPGGSSDLDDYWKLLEEISRMEEPAVCVVKTVGSRPLHECVLGDGMAKALFAAGCIGVVTDGGVRDVNGLLTIPFAAYCKGKTIHHCSLRFQGLGNPVEMGGITIRRGDVLHANAEGVIKIPDPCLKVLARKAVQMRAFEHEAHCILRRTDVGLQQKRESIDALLVKHGFARSKREVEL
jgi:4-hydroxy-4-methyl-2-oxoglutarate aldolase